MKFDYFSMKIDINISYKNIWIFNKNDYTQIQKDSVVVYL